MYLLPREMPATCQGDSISYPKQQETDPKETGATKS